MKNYKTTVCGIVAGLPTILGALGVAIPEPISKLVLAVGAIIGFFFAKDNDKTGVGA